MKHRLLSLIVFAALAFISVFPLAAQEMTPEPMVETYQVPGFPPFAPAPTMLEVVEDRGDTVIVRHAFGQTEIARNPQRVFTDASTISTALLLDLDIIATDITPDLAALLQEEALLEKVDVFQSNTYGLNPERVLSVNPDLIITWVSVIYSESGDPEGTYEQLSLIAPTIVLIEDTYAQWQQAAIDLADALGRTDSVAQKLATFEQSVDEACMPLQTALGSETAVRVTAANGEVVLYDTGYESGSSGEFVAAADTRWIYEYCELLPPTVLPELGDSILSRELLPQLNAEHIFFTLHDEESSAFYAELADDPLWQTIPAVRNGNVYFIPYSVSAYSYETALFAINSAAEAIATASAS